MYVKIILQMEKLILVVLPTAVKTFILNDILYK